MPEIFKNYIGGNWVAAQSRRTYENRNPANSDDLIGLFPDSGADDVDAAVQAAKKAYPAWRAVPPPRRAELLLKVRDLLLQDKEKFARGMTREMGKVLKETLGDVQEAIDMAGYSFGEGRRLFGQTTPSELPNKQCLTLRMPVGVCGLITPWNFPFAIPAWKIFPALLCGNTVVLKPAEDVPWSAVQFLKVLEKAGIPPGVVNMVIGFGEKAGAPLVRHPDVRLVSFTGSCEVGREVAEVCGRLQKKVSLEMGGKNAQIVMDDADLDLALEGAVWGAFGTTGQRCTATSRLIVHEKILKPFTRRLVERAKKIKIGNGLHPKVEMGPLINEQQFKKVMQYMVIAKKEGAKILCGGKPYSKGKKGFFFEPTVLDHVTPKMRVAQEEIFGPVVALLPCQNLKQAIQIHNSTSYGLSSAIYTRDVNRAFEAMMELEAGITYINGPTIGAEVHLPFGGIKNTGNGHREAGLTGLDIFSEWKSVFVDYSGKLQKAQIDVD